MQDDQLISVLDVENFRKIGPLGMFVQNVDVFNYFVWKSGFLIVVNFKCSRVSFFLVTTGPMPLVWLSSPSPAFIASKCEHPSCDEVSTVGLLLVYCSIGKEHM